jgi:hypothetical protein
MPTHDELNARYDEHFDRLNSKSYDEDTIVVDEDDLRAVLSQRQQRDDDIVVVDEDDLRDVLNRR